MAATQAGAAATAPKKKDDTLITTPVGRLSFPSLFEKTSFGDGKPKFEATILVKKSEDLKPLAAAVNAIIKEKYAGKQIPPGLKKPWRDGAEKPQLDGYDETVYFLRASSTQKVVVVDRNKQEILAGDDVFPGANCRLRVKPFWYDQRGNKGVGLRLLAVQLLGGGDPLGGTRVTPETAFDDDLPDAPEGTDDDLDEMMK